MAVGLTAKLISQMVESPYKIRKLTYDDGAGNIKIRRFLLIDEEKDKHIDFDLSTTYKINNKSQLGISLMNIAGTKLISKNNKKESIRSYGVGFSHKIERVHLGTDIIVNQKGDVDFSAGINFVPFSNTEFNLGYGTAFSSFVVGAKYKIKVSENVYFAPTYSFFRNNEFGETHFLGATMNF